MFKPASIDLHVPLSRNKKRAVVSEDNAAAWLESMKDDETSFSSVASWKKSKSLLWGARFGYVLFNALCAFVLALPAAVIVWSIVFATSGRTFTDVGMQMSYVLPCALIAVVVVGLLSLPADLHNRQAWGELKKLEFEGLRIWFTEAHTVVLPEWNSELDSVVTHLLAGDRSQGWKAVLQDAEGQHWQLKPAHMKKNKTSWSAHKVEAPSPIEQGARRTPQ